MRFGHKTITKTLIAGLSVALLHGCGKNVDPADTIIHGIGYVGLTVSDLAATTDFYARGTDLRAVEDSGIGLEGLEGLVGSVLLRSSNAQVRVMQFAELDSTPPVPLNGPGIAHLCYQVNATTNTYENFLAAGAGIIGGRDMVKLIDRNPVHYAYATDLDGVVIEIQEIDVAALELDEPPANNYRIRHISLATPDMERALAFYKVLFNEPSPRRAGNWFGLSGDRADELFGMKDSEVQMAWFQIRNLEFEIIEHYSHPTEAATSPRPLQAPGYSMIVFDVADLDKARARLLEAGGELVSEPEATEGGQVFFGRDPDGNLLGFQRVADSSALSSRNFANNGL